MTDGEDPDGVIYQTTREYEGRRRTITVTRDGDEVRVEVTGYTEDKFVHHFRDDTKPAHRTVHSYDRTEWRRLSDDGLVEEGPMESLPPWVLHALGEAGLHLLLHGPTGGETDG